MNVNRKTVAAFQRRLSNYEKRGRDISNQFRADFYLVVRWEGRYSVFDSVHEPGWPPSKDELVRRSEI